jgi:hypothetical protein
MVWKGLVDIAGKLDKIYIMKCPKYMYGNQMNKIWDSYLPCIAMAHSPQVIYAHSMEIIPLCNSVLDEKTAHLHQSMSSSQHSIHMHKENQQILKSSVKTELHLKLITSD